MVFFSFSYFQGKCNHFTNIPDNRGVWVGYDPQAWGPIGDHRKCGMNNNWFSFSSYNLRKKLKTLEEGLMTNVLPQGLPWFSRQPGLDTTECHIKKKKLQYKCSAFYKVKHRLSKKYLKYIKKATIYRHQWLNHVAFIQLVWVKETLKNVISPKMEENDTSFALLGVQQKLWEGMGEGGRGNGSSKYIVSHFNQMMVVVSFVSQALNWNWYELVKLSVCWSGIQIIQRVTLLLRCWTYFKNAGRDKFKLFAVKDTLKDKPSGIMLCREDCFLFIKFLLVTFISVQNT